MEKAKAQWPGWVSCCLCVGVFPNGREEQVLCFWCKKRVLTVVCIYVPNDSSEYPAVLESLSGLLEVAPPGDSYILLRNLGAHVGNDMSTQIRAMVTVIIYKYL